MSTISFLIDGSELPFHLCLMRAFRIVADIALQMKMLHLQDTFHRYLKAENILSKRSRKEVISFRDVQFTWKGGGILLHLIRELLFNALTAAFITLLMMNLSSDAQFGRSSWRPSLWAASNGTQPVFSLDESHSYQSSKWRITLKSVDLHRMIHITRRHELPMPAFGSYIHTHTHRVQPACSNWKPKPKPKPNTNSAHPGNTTGTLHSTGDFWAPPWQKNRDGGQLSKQLLTKFALIASADKFRRGEGMLPNR